jgi:hypothetical protein
LNEEGCATVVDGISALLVATTSPTTSTDANWEYTMIPLTGLVFEWKTNWKMAL